MSQIRSYGKILQESKKRGIGHFVGGTKWPVVNSDSFCQVTLNNRSVKSLLDSGSPVSFIDYSLFRRLFPNLSIRSESLSFQGVSGKQFSTFGVIQLPLSICDKCVIQRFYLINSAVPVILGVDSLRALGVSLRFSSQRTSIDIAEENEKISSIQDKNLTDDEYLRLFQLPTKVSQSVLIQLQQLLLEFKDIFSTNKLDLGLTTVGYHEICTGNANPIYSKPYRVAHSEKDTVKELVADMLSNEVIEETQSPWSSPFILLNKKDGTKRFAVDYRKLNAVTVKDRCPLPNTEELIDKLSTFRVFSLLDLTSGFWQIPLTEEAKSKTAFVTDDNQYQFKVMPFGLCNSPSTFQRIMQKVLKDLPTTPYIDDLIVPTKTVSEQMKLLKQIFQRLREAKFKLKPEKCSFLTNRIKYLGFVVEDGHLFPDPEKVEAIRCYKLPTTAKDMQRFLGLCNFFGRFIYKFSDIAQPLTDIQNKPAKKFPALLEANRKNVEEAFNKLKEALVNVTSLALPNFSDSFSLYVDASDIAISGVLCQQNGPVSFFNQKLKTSQKNYSTTDKEFLALYTSIIRFHHYLFGKKFTVYSDHKPLTSLVFGKPNNSRQARWQMTLQEYNLEIKYTKGSENLAADALSRSCVAPICESWTLKIQAEQKNCDVIKECVQCVEEEKQPHNGSELQRIVAKCFNQKLNTFSVENGFLKHNHRLVIPERCVRDLIVDYHECGHFSNNETWKCIADRYWCPRLRSRIAEIVNNCECKILKSYGHNPPPSHFPSVQPFEVVSLDIVTKLPYDRGYRNLLTMIDVNTKWLVAVPLSKISAENVSKAFLHHWIYKFGSPAAAHTDQGKQFSSNLYDVMLNNFNIQTSFSSIYHKKGNSIIERVHRTLKDRLRTMNGRWIDNIEEAVFNCNRLSGAFQAVYNRSALPRCDWPLKSDFLVRKSTKSGPQEGDSVAIRDRKPLNTLAPRFTGRFRVKERYGNSVILPDGRQVNLHDTVRLPP